MPFRIHRCSLPRRTRPRSIQTGYCAKRAREQVNSKKLLVLAWISLDGEKKMPWALGKALKSTQLAEFDAVHLLSFLDQAYFCCVTKALYHI